MRFRYDGPRDEVDVFDITGVEPGEPPVARTVKPGDVIEVVHQSYLPAGVWANA